jgi:hypothetical protein
MSFSNHWSSTRIADVSADAARDHVTFDWGGPGWVTIRRVGDTEYEKGDVAGLEDDLGLTDAQATQYAGQWISIPIGDQEYTTDGLTLASVVHDRIPLGRLKVLERKWHGKRFLVVKGKTARGYSSTLRARAGSRLPVHFSGGMIDAWIDSSFSKWNEPLHVEAPANATPIATVRG